jgi:Holliday junction resolvase-like predicted endonuclease
LNGKKKGNRGENEFLRVLVSRGWHILGTPSLFGGEDFVALDPEGRRWSIEVKKCKVLTQAHLNQALLNAKRSRNPWMLAQHIYGTSWWLVRRKNHDPELWSNVYELQKESRVQPQMGLYPM